MIHFSYFQYKLSRDKLKTPDMWDLENKKHLEKTRTVKYFPDKDQSPWVPINDASV